MRLGPRLITFVGTACVLPLVVLGGAGGSIARERISRAVEEQQEESAVQLAAALSRHLANIDRLLVAQMGSFRLDTSPDEARAAFVFTTWRLFPEISIAVLLDGSGEPAAAPYSVSDRSRADGHDVVDAERLARFLSTLPDAAYDPVWGPPYVPDGADAAAIAAVYPSRFRDGMALAVELSLAPLREHLHIAAGENRAALLVDIDGEVLLAEGRSPLVDPVRLRPLLRSPGASVRLDDEVLVATRLLSGGDMAVVMASPTLLADAALVEFRKRTLYVLVGALGVALLAAAWFGRLITQPVDQLRAAAQAIGAGDLSTRVALESDDELGELGKTFDTMAATLGEQRAEIDAKNRQLEDWNASLERQVDERTTQLVQSRQLAAVAEMSAGLAHELNNPLAGILGLVQVVRQMRAGSPDAALLASAEEQALRCKDIVSKLLRFTGGTGAGGRERTDLVGLVRDLVSLSESGFRQRDVGVRFVAREAEVPVMVDPEEMGRALSQVLNALRTVAEAGSTLTVYVGRSDGRAEVGLELDRVRDSEDDWRANALGLWAARQVFDLHQAALDELPVPSGRAWRVATPLAPGGGAR